VPARSRAMPSGAGASGRWRAWHASPGGEPPECMPVREGGQTRPSASVDDPRDRVLPGPPPGASGLPSARPEHVHSCTGRHCSCRSADRARRPGPRERPAGPWARGAPPAARRTNRLHPGALARSLSSSVLDSADPDPESVTDLLDQIPGACDDTTAGLADAAAGPVRTLDELWRMARLVVIQRAQANPRAMIRTHRPWRSGWSPQPFGNPDPSDRCAVLRSTGRPVAQSSAITGSVTGLPIGGAGAGSGRSTS
jgi:hypothetical protein